MSDPTLLSLIKEETNKVVAEQFFQSDDDGDKSVEISFFDDYEEKYGVSNFVNHIKDNIIDTMHFVLETMIKAPFLCYNKERRELEKENVLIFKNFKNIPDNYPGPGFTILKGAVKNDFVKLIKSPEDSEPKQNKKDFKKFKKIIISIIDKLLDVGPGSGINKDTLKINYGTNHIYLTFKSEPVNFCKFFYEYTMIKTVSAQDETIRNLYRSYVDSPKENKGSSARKNLRKVVHKYTIENLLKKELTQLSALFSSIKTRKPKTTNNTVDQNAKNRKTPAEKTPAEQTPAEKTAAEKTPAEQTPAEKTAAKQTPAEKPAAAAATGPQTINVDLPKSLTTAQHFAKFRRVFTAAGKDKKNNNFPASIDELEKLVRRGLNIGNSKEVKESAKIMSQIEKYILRESSSLLKEQDNKPTPPPADTPSKDDSLRTLVGLIYVLQTTKLGLKPCSQVKKGTSCADGLYGGGTHKLLVNLLSKSAPPAEAPPATTATQVSSKKLDQQKKLLEKWSEWWGGRLILRTSKPLTKQLFIDP